MTALAFTVVAALSKYDCTNHPEDALEKEQSSSENTVSIPYV